MRLLDLVTVEDILNAFDGRAASEGIGRESAEDLMPLCGALVDMALRDALAKASVAPPSRLQHIWAGAKRRLLETRWGSRRAVRDVPAMMRAIQMVDIALRKKWGLRRAGPHLKM